MLQPALLRMAAVNEQKLSFRDGMLLAAVPEAGCSAIVSEDMQQGRCLGSVEVVNPLALQPATTMEKLLDA